MMISFKFLLENFEIIFQRGLTLVEYNTGCAKKEVFFFLHTLLPYIFFYIFEEHIFQRISLPPVSPPTGCVLQSGRRHRLLDLGASSHQGRSGTLEYEAIPVDGAGYGARAAGS